MDNDSWMLIDCYEVCKLNDAIGLRERATNRGLSDRSWACCDDLNQLIRLGAELNFVDEEFSNDLSTLMASGGVTLAGMVALCNT